MEQNNNGEDPGDFDYDRDFFFCMTKVNDKLDDFIYAPSILDGHKVMAGVDSMANRSFISVAFAKGLGKKIWPLSGKIVLGTKGQKAARIGLIRDVLVEVDKKKFKHNFEILELSDNTDAVFGLDIFGKAGIGLQGVPVDYPQEAIEAMVEMKDEELLAGAKVDSTKMEPYRS